MTKKKLSASAVKIKYRQLAKRIEKANELIRKLKQVCDHVGAIEYSPDPSGNNDSSYDCSACGASWRRWPDDVPRN